MRVLITDIVYGTLPVGGKLPSELQLVAQFGVSRGVIRECIRGLEERGLVSIRHGTGGTVQPPEAWDVFDAEVVGALLDGPDGPAMLGEYLACRRLLEIEAAGVAAERATNRDIDALKTAVQRMRSAAARAAANPLTQDMYHEADIDFHRLVFAAAHNRALARMAEPLHRTMIARRLLSRPHIQLGQGIPEHQGICDAIAARDVDGARAAMDAHLRALTGHDQGVRTERARRSVSQTDGDRIGAAAASRGRRA